MKNICKSLLWSVLVGSSAALSMLPAQAFTPFSLTQTFNNPITFNNPPSRGGQFGISVSIDGVYTLIGDENYVNNFGVRISGSAFLFDAVTGNLLQTFNNPNPNLGDDFGSSVSISGTKALVGAHSDDTGARNAGSAYLFDTVTGNLLQTFNNPTPQNSDIFGESVSISGTNALIGAYGDDTGAFNTGSAYLFDTETGHLLHTFNNPTPQQNDQFGRSVSISGTNALIGAHFDDTGAVGAGSAYLFDTVTGNLLHTFNNPTPEVGDAFGFSVSIDGTNALIGAYGDNTGAVVAGSAYLFDTVTGNLLHTFNNPTPQLIQSGDSFGFSVSIDGTNALIGAFGDDTGATDAGSAYLFDAVTGNLLQTFNNPFPQLNDYFGHSVSISDTGIFIGARGDQNIRETNVGSAYLYQSDSTSVPETSSVFGLFLITGFSVLVTKHQS